MDHFKNIVSFTSNKYCRISYWSNLISPVPFFVFRMSENSELYLLLLLWILLYCFWLLPQMDLKALPSLLLNLWKKLKLCCVNYSCYKRTENCQMYFQTDAPLGMGIDKILLIPMTCLWTQNSMCGKVRQIQVFRVNNLNFIMIPWTQRNR